MIGRIETSTMSTRMTSMLFRTNVNCPRKNPRTVTPRGPQHAADGGVGEIALGVHLCHARHHRDERAHDRDEPAEHDGAVAVLLEDSWVRATCWGLNSFDFGLSKMAGPAALPM